MGNLVRHELVGELWRPPGYEKGPHWELFADEARYLPNLEYRIFRTKRGQWRVRNGWLPSRALTAKSFRDDRLVAAELERRAGLALLAPEQDEVLIAHIRALEVQLFFAKRAFWATIVFALLEFACLLSGVALL